jgi:DNA-binding HxlR family transcriptional regulator
MKKDTETEAAAKTNKCPCLDPCPLQHIMRILGGRWKIPILCSLNMDGTTRYNDLKRKVRGITNTVLASSLRELEEAGLVTRQQFAEIPVRVEYALTAHARDLMPIIIQFIQWSLSINNP